MILTIKTIYASEPRKLPRLFKNSTKELDLLVELARKHAATLGARLTGGGFGGATIKLDQTRRDQTIQRLHGCGI